MHDFTCPCQSQLSYYECCSRFHHQKAAPQTARELMQSRYSAFYYRLEDYLFQTWSLKTRPALSHILPSSSIEWVDLKIVGCSEGTQADLQGTVEFIAKYKNQGRVCGHQELSLFEKQDNFWVYVKAL